MAIRIRPAVGGDIEAMCRLLESLFRIEADFEPDRDRQQRALTRLLARPDAARVFVAEQAGEVVGMASVQVVISTAEGGEVGWVEDVVVQAGQRGLGIGRALLAAIETWAVRRGLTRLQLLADRENRPALDFYGRLGWTGTQLVAMRRPVRP